MELLSHADWNEIPNTSIAPLIYKFEGETQAIPCFWFWSSACVVRVGFVLHSAILCFVCAPLSFLTSMVGISSGLKEFFVDPNLMLQIPEDKWLKCLVLISMVLQIMLIYVGAVRHRCVNRILASVGWLAYISADAVAMYALGLMVHSDRSSGMGIFYVVWAPVLLIHLGGPDSITAYALADNELWPRHAVTMSYHVCVAAYVIYTPALEAAEKGEWYLLAAAVLLFIAGSCKYVERTVALWLASSSEIVSYALPIHKYMQHQIGVKLGRDNYKWNYIVTGYQELDELMSEEENYERLRDELMSEEEKNEWLRDKLRKIGVVTLEDVLQYEGGQTDTENYVLCASYALFKMYTPRLARLSLPEEGLFEISAFFRRVSRGAHVFTQILNKEMRFVYDYLFCKSRGTAFSKWGALMRVGNTCFLAVACFLIFNRLPAKAEEKDGDGGQEMVTYIVMSVAVALEVFQLCKIMVSDWAMVWLISSYIRRFQRPGRTERYSAKLMKSVMVVLGKVRKVLADNDEKGWIQQHSLRTSPLVRKVREVLYLNEIVPYHIKATLLNVRTKASILWGPFLSYPGRNQHEIYEELHRDVDLSGESVEVQILAWHVATTICEGLDHVSNVPRWRIDRSRMLSRYFGYLMMSWPEMLPVHPIIAKKKYEELYSEISGLIHKSQKNATEVEFSRILFREWKGKSAVGIAAAKLAHQLQHCPDQRQPWDKIDDFWRGLFVYCGFYFKAAAHGERMTRGGEVLTQEWLTLGHLGIGERSDSAVADRASEWEKKHYILGSLGGEA